MAKKPMDDESPMVGAPAPAFDLPDQNGKRHKTADYKGRYVVLFWYPKDATPGCTKEACGFRDSAEDFAEAGAVVLGASVLDSASKAKFAAKHNLGFPLLADEDHAAAEAFGVWKEKSMYGRKYMGIARETFVIGPDGEIAAHWPKAAGSESHAAEVLRWLKENAR
ncbi:MAG: thioredoxin-dependent thiol peroxidase [Opitutales bacterium]|nr:thioredoxin-dependent thiol peroxidase [Opitutales bacterium]